MRRKTQSTLAWSWALEGQSCVASMVYRVVLFFADGPMTSAFKTKVVVEGTALVTTKTSFSVRSDTSPAVKAHGYSPLPPGWMGPWPLFGEGAPTRCADVGEDQWCAARVLKGKHHIDLGAFANNAQFHQGVRNAIAGKSAGVEAAGWRLPGCDEVGTTLPDSPQSHPTCKTRRPPRQTK